jgi:hypothetical protein
VDFAGQPVMQFGDFLDSLRRAMPDGAARARWSDLTKQSPSVARHSLSVSRLPNAWPSRNAWPSPADLQVRVDHAAPSAHALAFELDSFAALSARSGTIDARAADGHSAGHKVCQSPSSESAVVPPEPSQTPLLAKLSKEL